VKSIAELKPGDEIIIKGGYGDPPVEKDTEDIIAAVGGFSALTISGIKLSCWNEAGVKPTGEHFEKFELSEKAKEILKRTS